MAYDEYLGERISNYLQSKKVSFEDRKMMGGLCFMIDDKMCVGVVKNQLMARVGPNNYASSLERKGANPMDFTGRPMKGYVFVNPEGYDLDVDLEHWIDLCLKFNPEAKASKRK